MRLFRYSYDSLSCVKFVKQILPFIGNITSFSVYQNESDIPTIYRNVPTIYLYNGDRVNSEETYHMIIRNENDDVEVWLGDCNCGYSGTGPYSTVQVLQLLGVRLNYNIIYTRNIVIEHNPLIAHNLNFLVYQTKDELAYRKEIRLKVTMKFDNPSDKWQAKSALGCFGYIQPLINILKDKRDESFYFSLPYSVDNEHEDYTTNNAILLKKDFDNISDDLLKLFIERLTDTYNGKVNIQMFPRNIK